MSAKNYVAFALEYAKVYALMQYELRSHLGECKAESCKEFGDGFRKAFNMLPKPPASRKGRRP